MIRFLLFLLLLVPLMFAGNWLLVHQGDVTIQWFNYTIEIKTALAVFAMAGVCIFITIILLLLWQLMGWPERRRARKRYRTLARGLAHLTQGFTALALGDESAAVQALKKARVALPNEPLPQLLTAQLMQRQGNHEEARGFLRALLKHESTSVLATHKLIEQHMGRREWTEAIALAESAQKDAPRDRWVLLTLIDLYAHTGNITRMLELTEGWQFRSPLSRAERHRVAALAHYLLSNGEEDATGKLRELQQTVNYAPDFLPAMLAYSHLMIAQGERRRARKTLLAAWKRRPLLPLVSPILQSINDVSAHQQSRLLKSFAHEPMQALDHLLRAQQLIQAGEFEQAKPLIEAALTLEESKHACTLMADVERELRGTPAATGWMARAMDAPTAESWLCERCGHAHKDWQLHCGSCNAFDSLAYERPEARITSVAVAAT